MAGPDPVVRSPACQNTNNDLDDGHPMNEDEHLDFAQADQQPFPSPTVPTLSNPLHSSHTQLSILYHTSSTFLGFVNTSLYKGCCGYSGFFVGYTESDIRVTVNDSA